MNFDSFFVFEYHRQNMTLSWNGQSLVKFPWNMITTVSVRLVEPCLIRHRQI